MTGIILGDDTRTMRAGRPGVTVGSPGLWVDTLVSYYEEVGIDSFVFWPSGGDEKQQVRLFAEKVAPAVREQLAQS